MFAKLCISDNFTAAIASKIMNSPGYW